MPVPTPSRPVAVKAVAAAARAQRLETIVCGGGCFLNHILSRGLVESLTRRGFNVLLARQLPPNDGGLSLGQAWVALQTYGE